MKPNTAEPRPTMPHLLTVSERNSLSVSGVCDVGTFDETAVVVETVQGRLTVKGRGLRVTRISLETGDLSLEGTVDAMLYEDSRARAGGLFGRLFR